MRLQRPRSDKPIGRVCLAQGFVDQALKSASVTLGSFLTNATMVQISWSDTSVRPKLGIPVLWMRFLMTQNRSCGLRWSTSSLRSGGGGRNPSENSPIHARGAVAVAAAALEKSARPRLHDRGIVERHRR